MWAKGVQMSPKLQLRQPNLGQINPIVTATYNQLTNGESRTDKMIIITRLKLPGKWKLW